MSKSQSYIKNISTTLTYPIKKTETSLKRDAAMQSSIDFYLKPKILKNDINIKSSPTENQNKLIEKNNVKEPLQNPQNQILFSEALENDIEVID